MRFAKTTAIAASCALLLGAGPVRARSPGTVNVLLQDPSTGDGVTAMQIVATPDAVPAGRITFHVVNQSKGLVHEMLLLKAPGNRKLPYDAKAQRVVEAKTTKLVDTDDIKPGESVTKSATLKPGSYLMICNQPTHFAAGMKEAFTVTR